MSTSRKTIAMSAGILYIVSLLGIIDVIGEHTFAHQQVPLMGLDLSIYIFLLLAAILMHRGIVVARIIYGIVAIAWYSLLIFILPVKFGHTLDLYMVFMQIVLTLIAFALLLPKKQA